MLLKGYFSRLFQSRLFFILHNATAQAIVAFVVLKRENILFSLENQSQQVVLVINRESDIIYW